MSRPSARQHIETVGRITRTDGGRRFASHHLGVIDPRVFSRWLPDRHRSVRRNRRRAGHKGSWVQALNHSSLNFNSFALRRPFCGRIKLICIGGGWALPGRDAIGVSGLVATARPVGKCCVMGRAVSINSAGWIDARPACAGAWAKRRSARPQHAQDGTFDPFSGGYDRFATRFMSLARGAVGRRLSYGVGSRFPAIVIVGTMNSGMVDSGAAMAGVHAPAKWGGSAGSDSLLNRGGG
jgi:hypothetical protein